MAVIPELGLWLQRKVRGSAATAELAGPHGVAVSLIQPGFIRTAIDKNYTRARTRLPAYDAVREQVTEARRRLNQWKPNKVGNIQQGY